MELKGMPDKKKPTATQGVNIEPCCLNWAAAGDAGKVKCVRCYGTGQLKTHPFLTNIDRVDCPECAGTGMVEKKSPEKCRICNEPLKEFPNIKGLYCLKCNWDNVPRTKSFLGVDWGKEKNE